MMTKGMKEAKTSRKSEDKPTNILCSSCGDVVGVVAAGYTLTLRDDENSTRHVGLCRCGKKMIYRVCRG